MTDIDNWTPPCRPGIEGILEEEKVFYDYAEVGQVPTTPHPISAKMLKLQKEQVEREN